jgi:hypothetical protein
MDGYINTQNGGVEMEIDGSVLCHIKTLYSTTHDPSAFRLYSEKMPNRRETKICTFPFGELTWNTVDGKTHAHFQPGLEKELASPKIPFGRAGMKLEPETLVASYLTALDHGVSDASFRLADPSAPISDRIDKFLKYFEGYKWREEPYIISRGWFEEAARVKKRILAEGGSNRSSYEVIKEAIHQKDKAKPWAGEEYYLEREVRSRFFFDEDTFHFYLEGLSGPSGNILGDSFIFELPRVVLKSYKGHPLGSWKRTLYETRGQVLQVFGVKSDVYVSKGMLLLEFTRSSELWKEKVHLGALT